MFENLTNKLESIFSKLKSAPSLTEEQVDSGLKEIRLALLEADVALPVTKEFIANVKPKAIGKEIACRVENQNIASLTVRGDN